MKSRILTGVFILWFFTAVAQVGIDGIVTVDLPKPYRKLDTTINKIRTLNLISSNDKEIYLLQRISMGSKLALVNPLPKGQKSLTKSYYEVLKGNIRVNTRNGSFLKDSSKVEIDGLQGYKLIYANSETLNNNQETVLLILNEHLYSAAYINHIDFDEENKSIFLNSLKINKEKGATQTIDEPIARKTGYWLGAYIAYALFGLLFLGIIFLIRKVIKKI